MRRGGDESRFIALMLVVALCTVALATALPVLAAAGNQGLQGGWAIDDGGNVAFPHSVKNQLPLMVDAGAGWVRVNFRLGGCYANWADIGCNGVAATAPYDAVVNDARARGLKVLGLLSPESWHGAQAAWTANSAEIAAGSGDNAYLQAFSQGAAVVLVRHFHGRISAWQVWNEPNVWASNPAPGVYTGGTFIYPSNFAWLLRHVYEDTRIAGLTGVAFVSGGVVGHDPAGLTRLVAATPTQLHGEYRPAKPMLRPDLSAAPSGAPYLISTYEQGVLYAGWNDIKQTYQSYPLDAVGQHLYVDQFGRTTSSTINAYLNDLRQAYLALEGGQTTKKTIVTEVGWSTAYVSAATQSDNLRVAYSTFKAAPFVSNAYWFSVQDVPEAGLYFGLQTGGSARDGYKGKPKPAFRTYQKHAVF